MMWSDNGGNQSADVAVQLKEMRVKYTKAMSRCRKAELELKNQTQELAMLRRENDTLRVTPLLSKGSGSSQQGNRGSQSNRTGGAGGSRVKYLERALKEREDEIRNLKRCSSFISAREAKASSKEYLAEIQRLRSALYGAGQSSSSPSVPGGALFRLLETGSGRDGGAKPSREKAILKENKRLRRSLEFEKDRYRRYLVSEISADKMLDAEMEPFRHGYSMGDVIEAQQVEINRLRQQCTTLKENNEVLQGSLGKALAFQRVEGM